MTTDEQVLAFEVAIDATEIAESKTVLVWLDDAKALLTLLQSQAAELERVSKANEVCRDYADQFERKYDKVCARWSETLAFVRRKAVDHESLSHHRLTTEGAATAHKFKGYAFRELLQEMENKS